MPQDWKSILKEYIRAVLHDDQIVAQNCADHGGTGEDDDLWQLFLEVWREENEDNTEAVEPRTSEESRAIFAAALEELTPEERAARGRMVMEDRNEYDGKLMNRALEKRGR